MKIPLEYIHWGWVNRERHNTANLFIYSYNKDAVEIVGESRSARILYKFRACNGLITTTRGKIHSFPFPQIVPLQFSKPILRFSMGLCEVYKKLEGYLGVMYFVKGNPYMATRESFHSDEAERATTILYQKYSHVIFKEQFTYVFQVSRATMDMTLLSVRKTESGSEVSSAARGMFAKTYNIPTIYPIAGVEHASQLAKFKADHPGEYIVYFSNGVRVII